MFRSSFRSSSESSYVPLLKSLILKFVKNEKACTHTKCYAAASPHWLFTFLTNFKISDFNKGTYELPEDNLNDDRNMLERF